MGKFLRLKSGTNWWVNILQDCSVVALREEENISYGAHNTPPHSFQALWPTTGAAEK